MESYLHALGFVAGICIFAYLMFSFEAYMKQETKKFTVLKYLAYTLYVIGIFILAYLIRYI